MEKIRLGRTGLMVTRCGFGALPIQRVDMAIAREILVKAYEAGINFYDTARAYSDSEVKLGEALSHVRKNIIIATKTHARDRETFFKHLETSLKNLKTDYIDILQLHNIPEMPDFEDPDGLYGAMMEAKKKGMIRFAGMTNHRLYMAEGTIASGKFDTLQFPLNFLSADKDLALIESCKAKDVGVIAMKGLSGGLITNAAATFAFLRQYDNVVPIWGIQRMHELEEFLTLEKNPPVLDEAMWKIIEADRKELSGGFCRSCGYCMPCPEGIQIPTAARIVLLMNRAPYQQFLTETFKAQMDLVEECQECGQCKEKCPYELDTPELLRQNLKGYRELVRKYSEG
ncbi:MAG: aldo/keto reductase [Proteobacteria bacterium]|nr:aldo/keto reductase [Pseudomonadota bacterium]MBU4470022.1 aldo/keto reductase [Pseudomonadota bacterium]MCG2753802.1 aldo/keto reductase [Desulfobacteraceae bacterium]